MRTDTVRTLQSKKLIPFCPIVEPTEAEFENFSRFVEKAEEKYKNEYGMIKIVPPKSWKPRCSPYEQSLENLLVENPIEQNPEGTMGIYEFKHVTMPSITYQNYISQNQSKENPLNGKNSEEIETLFWKTLLYSSPMYGADLLGTLMDETAGEWNLNALDTVLQKGLEKNLRGVNTSYCYIGSWKALFCWHKEDMDLEAINFLHFGKPKFWYCIHPEDFHILEGEAKKHFFKGYESCSEYLRHKTCLINPYILKSKYPNLRITKIEQNPGEFIIAFSGAYHCGFNFGINVAEAVNFASLNWLYKLKNAKYCKCKSSSVRVSYELLIDRLCSMSEFKENPIVKELKAEIESQVESTEYDHCISEKNKKTKKIEKVKSVAKSQHNHKEQLKGTKEEYVTEIQCDNCERWHKISQKNSNYKDLVAFFCANLGEKCRNFKKASM